MTSRRVGRVSSSARSSRRGGGPVVAPPGRAATGGREPLTGADGEDRVRPAELMLVAGGLLEVKAEDLVELHEPATVLEPVGEALVQLRPHGFRERVVGGVADQQVAEAEAVLARELSLLGMNQVPPHESGQPRGHLRLLRHQRLHDAPVEDLALDRAPLEHAPLGRVELVEPGREQRLQGRRHDDLATGLLAIPSISAMKSGLPPAAAAILAPSSSTTPRPIKLVASSASSGSSRIVTGQVGRPSSNSGRAMHNSSSEAPLESSADMLDQVEERLLAPLNVVEQDDERRLLLEQLAERPGDLLRRGAPVGLAEQRAKGRRGRRIGRERAELLHDLHHRPVGDPAAVGKTATANNPDVDRPERLRHEPRLAEPRVPDDRQELAPLLR